MNVADCEKVAQELWGKDHGITFRRTDKNVCQVIDKAGNVLGAGFSWDAAMRQAAEPVLRAAEQDSRQRAKAAQARALAFMQFLMEKHHEEFEKWMDAHDPDRKSGDQTSPPGRAPADQGKLVQIVRG
jgi:hypothetical protein